MKRLAAKHLDMLGYFVRLVDYSAIETLVSIVRQAISKFHEEMMNRKTRLFNTSVKYGKDCMVFNPD